LKGGEKYSSRSYRRSTRFWFYPILPSIAVRENVVAIKGLQIGVFTEVSTAEMDGSLAKSLSTLLNQEAERFANAVTDLYGELAKTHVSFARLLGLDELVALTKALEELEDRPDLTFWLQDYSVKPVSTKKEIKVIKQEKANQELSGGVQLTAIALRLKAGDITALREAVLATRPTPEVLSWPFVVEEWIIPLSDEMSAVEDMAPLITQALFLHQQRRYEDVIAVYGKMLARNPRLAVAYHNRGSAYLERGQYAQAIADYTRVLEIDSRVAETYIWRGITYAMTKQYAAALHDFNQALELQPQSAKVYFLRGAAYNDTGQYDQAITDYTKALAIDPRLSRAYHSRGSTYDTIGQSAQALADYSRAIEFAPHESEYYLDRGAFSQQKAQYAQALADYNRALELQPAYAEVYYNQAALYEKIGRRHEAVAAYKSFIKYAKSQHAAEIEHARRKITELAR
jgi:tetratricopeptide (TPR) repeat protein